MGNATRVVDMWLRLHNKMGPKLTQALAQLEQFRKKANQIMGRWGKRIALVSAVALASIAAVGIGFEQEMANVQSIAGATTEQMTLMSAAAIEMGEKTAFSARQAAEAQYALVSSGLEVTDTLAALAPVMLYAGATQAGLAESAEAVTAALNSFQLAASESLRVVNVFAAGIRRSPLTMQRLADSMSYAGATASTMGLGIEETVAALGGLHQMGLKGSQAGVYFRSVMLQLNKAMNEQTGEIGELLQGWDSASEGLVGAMKRIEDAGMTGRDALSEFGMRGGPGLAALLTLGSEHLIKLQADITGTNQAVDAYNIQMETTQGKMKIFASVVQTVMIRSFDMFKETLVDVIVKLTLWVKAHSDKIVRFFGNIGNAIGTVAGWIGVLARFIASNSETLLYWAKVIGVGVVALYALSTAVAIVNAVMTANPIFLIITAIAALGVAINWAVEKMGGWAKAWFEVNKWFDIGVAGIQYGADILRIVVTQMGAEFKALWGVTQLTFGRVWDFMKDVGGKLLNLFKNVGRVIWGALTMDFSMISLGVTEGIATIKSGWLDAFDGFGEEFDEIWSSAFSGAADAAIISRFTDVVAQIAEISKRAFDGASFETGDGFIGPPLPDNFIPPEMQAELDRLRAMFNQMMDDMNDDTEDKMTAYGQALRDGFSSAWDSVLDIEMTGKARREQIWDAMKTAFWDHTGSMVAEHLWGEATKTGATVEGEGARQAAEKTGLLVSLAVSAARVAAWLKEAAVAIYAAVAGFFKAFASIPFLGAALAGAGIAVMFGALNKSKNYALGGLVAGMMMTPAGADVIPAMLNRHEFVMPPAQTAANLPALEAMRSGQPVGGAGGVTVELHIDGGSIVVLEDPIALRRIAEKLNDEIIKVQSSYRDLEG